MFMETIGILGTGVMGPQIAASLAMAGYDVLLYNHRESAETASRLRQWLRYGARKNPTRSASLDQDLSAIHVTTDLQALRGASIVIESVVEDLSVKQALFAELNRICRPDAILASNSSSLDLRMIGQAVQEKGRLLGLHFFNPVFETGLVEVIVTPETQAASVEKVVALATALKKHPLTVTESCVNRILFPMINEACMALEQKVFKAADIDYAFRLGANHPIGPLALADLIGLDVVVAILEKGQLGRKTGTGFFSYGKNKKIDAA
jgi:3-hydroxybutyryl-CoA dehydrogenase